MSANQENITPATSLQLKILGKSAQARTKQDFCADMLGMLELHATLIHAQACGKPSLGFQVHHRSKKSGQLVGFGLGDAACLRITYVEP